MHIKEHSTALVTSGAGAGNAAAWTKIRTVVLDGLSSDNSRRAYSRSLDDFAAWYAANAGGAPLSKAVVTAYAAALKASGRAPATVNVRLSAVRRLATEAADNGALDPSVAAAIGRVKGAKMAGSKAGNWLSLAQAEQLIALADRGRLKGKRDRAVLCVMIGCGLRRAEVSALTFGHIQQRDGRWCIVDLVSKGNRTRTVPMPSWAKVAIDEWTAAAAIGAGRVFRALNRGRLGEELDPHSIRHIVSTYGQRLGVAQLAPHDLRRTFAKLAHKGKAALEQIQLSLGHSSITTTERYLGVKQDLQNAPCDHLGLSV